VTERVEQADALRRREHQVEPRDRSQPLRLHPPLVGERVDAFDCDEPGLHAPTRTQLLLGVRMQAADQAAELAFLHNAVELERSGAAADPNAGRLAQACVVIVEACRDGAFVVALLAWRELRDAEHNATLALRPIYGSHSASVSACYLG